MHLVLSICVSVFTCARGPNLSTMKLFLTVLFLAVASSSFVQAQLMTDEEIEILAEKTLAERNLGISPANFVIIGEHEYYVETLNPMTVIQSTIFCNSLGMKLTSLQTAEKNTEIRDYLKSTVPTIAHWTSGQKMFGDNYQWSGTGELVVYFDWSSGRPVAQTGDVCVSVVGNTGWFDDKCSLVNMFICE